MATQGNPIRQFHQRIRSEVQWLLIRQNVSCQDIRWNKEKATLLKQRAEMNQKVEER